MSLQISALEEQKGIAAELGCQLGEEGVSWHAARDHYPAVCRGEKKRAEVAAWGRHKSNLGFVGFNSSQSPGIFSWKIPSATEPKGSRFLNRSCDAHGDKCCYSLTLEGSADPVGSGRHAAGDTQFGFYSSRTPVPTSSRRKGEWEADHKPLPAAATLLLSLLDPRPGRHPLHRQVKAAYVQPICIPHPARVSFTQVWPEI